MGSGQRRTVGIAIESQERARRVQPAPARHCLERVNWANFRTDVLE